MQLSDHCNSPRLARDALVLEHPTPVTSVNNSSQTKFTASEVFYGGVSDNDNNMYLSPVVAAQLLDNPPSEQLSSERKEGATFDAAKTSGTYKINKFI